MKIFISLSAAKGSVRMSAERIKHLLLKRKSTAARLAKVKRPTDKTKRRIARNTERIASLTTKLKIAVKLGAAKPKPKPKPVAKEAPTGKNKTETETGRGAAALKKSAPGSKKADALGKKHNMKGLSKIAENRVHKARKAYTEARLGGSSDPAKLADLKARYQKAFRSYMQVGRPASQSSAFFQYSADEDAVHANQTQTQPQTPGRFDPIVLAYNHIMGIAPTVKKLEPK